MPRLIPDSSFGRQRLEDFTLDTDIVYCNQGSFGALPVTIQAEQDLWRQRLARNPTGFFFTEYPARVRESAARVADFLGGESRDWVFVDNASSAASAVLNSLDLKPGDTLLTTSHAYGAVQKALAFFADRAGARVVSVSIPSPVSDPMDIITPIAQALEENGPIRVAFFDHVASPSAILFPVAELTALCRARGVPVFIDGAHAPGMLELDVPALGADWWVGNAHKWLFAPLGCALFWCRRDQQTVTRPTVVSHGINEGYTAAFDWIGTRDPSAWLSVGAAIGYHAAFPGLMARNHQLAVAAGEALAAEFGTVTVGPGRMLGSMVAIRMPVERTVDQHLARQLMIDIQRAHRVVVVFAVLDDRLWLRLSASIYNDIEDLITAGHAARQMVSS